MAKLSQQLKKWFSHNKFILFSTSLPSSIQLYRFLAYNKKYFTISSRVPATNIVACKMVQCIGNKSNGDRCTLQTPVGSIYCRYHVRETADAAVPLILSPLFQTLFYRLNNYLPIQEIKLAILGITLAFAYFIALNYAYWEGNIEYTLNSQFIRPHIAHSNAPFCNFAFNFAEFQSTIHGFQSTKTNFHYLIYGASGSGKYYV